MVNEQEMALDKRSALACEDIVVLSNKLPILDCMPDPLPHTWVQLNPLSPPGPLHTL